MYESCGDWILYSILVGVVKWGYQEFEQVHLGVLKLGTYVQNLPCIWSLLHVICKIFQGYVLEVFVLPRSLDC